jgi:hypothetical protein
VSIRIEPAGRALYLRAKAIGDDELKVGLPNPRLAIVFVIDATHDRALDAQPSQPLTYGIGQASW